MSQASGSIRDFGRDATPAERQVAAQILPIQNFSQVPWAKQKSVHSAASYPWQSRPAGWHCLGQLHWSWPFHGAIKDLQQGTSSLQRPIGSQRAELGGSAWEPSCCSMLPKPQCGRAHQGKACSWSDDHQGGNSCLCAKSTAFVPYWGEDRGCHRHCWRKINHVLQRY